MALTVGLPEISLGVLLLAGLQFLVSLLISERLKTSLQKEHSAFLENLKWELKVREQAVRVAEYLALATTLKENSPESDYRKANQMSWELAMWLPEDIYNKNGERNRHTQFAGECVDSRDLSKIAPARRKSRKLNLGKYRRSRPRYW